LGISIVGILFVVLFAILVNVGFATSDVLSSSDVDGDGFADENDPCPNLKEDYEGAVEGCPSIHKIVHDKDGDAIPDDYDMCPDRPEIYNGFLDEDGCPDRAPRDVREAPDSDNDGMIDVDDSCPNQPETYNGVLDFDGCPEEYSLLRDYDQDWIPNEIDECQMEKESYNRYFDHDGCPDKLPYGFDVTNFPDADNDGVDDRWDRCLGEAENYNGYLDYDGCIDDITELDDADGDGVYDREDVCPNHKENYNNFHDFDGCPDGGLDYWKGIIDSDKDRIPDSIDLCIYEKETWNKFQDKDGCPDIFTDQSRQIHDRDLDGIIDDEDNCPFEQETYNENNDEDGCPDGKYPIIEGKKTKYTLPLYTKIFPESLVDDPIKGIKKTPIVFVQFADFDCPFCAEFSKEILPLIEKNYIQTGKIKFVFRDFPMEGLASNSLRVHVAAQCAYEQGKFWEFHNLAFTNQPQWSSHTTTEMLKEFTTNLGLDQDKFDACLESDDAINEVNGDYLDGIEYGATHSPTFFIGNDKTGYAKLDGIHPYVTFKNTIEQQLKCAIYSC